MTYRELDNLVTGYEQRLREKGVGSGDRIAHLPAQDLKTLAPLFAVWRAGGAICFLNPRLPRKERHELARLMNCRWSFSPDIPDTRRISLRSSSAKNFKPAEEIPLDPGNPATLMPTSGSAAAPKIVVHSLANHFASAKAANKNIPVGQKDAWLLSLPLYHVSGLGILFRVFTAGGSVILNNRQQPLEQILRDFPVTHISLVATQLMRLLEENEGGSLRELKYILLGGSAIPAPLIKKARRKKLPLYLTYGLTETASQTATTASYNPKKKMPGVRVLENTRVKIAKGEILVKGTAVCLGYWNGKTITPAVDANGWFHTGDLGKLADGELAVLGRKDNMFISGGENIYPEEIERRLTEIKGIEQALVVPVEDKEFGQRPAAFIKTAKAVSIDDLKKELAKHLPKFKIPDVFFAWPSVAEKGIKLQRRDFMEFLQKKRTREID